jgi:hypothetical protein
MTVPTIIPSLARLNVLNHVHTGITPSDSPSLPFWEDIPVFILDQMSPERRRAYNKWLLALYGINPAIISTLKLQIGNLPDYVERAIAEEVSALLADRTGVVDRYWPQHNETSVKGSNNSDDKIAGYEEYPAINKRTGLRY